MGAFSYIHGQLGIGCRAELYLDSFFDRYRGYHLNWTIFVPTLRHYNKCIYFGSKEKLQQLKIILLQKMQMWSLIHVD